MNLQTLSPQPDNLAQQAANAFAQRRYAQAALFYEQLVTDYPNERHYGWYLGLTHLLQENEAEAQLTWMLVMAEAEALQLAQWAAELVAVLEAEAERQAAADQKKMAWVIRQHLRELNPTDVNNLLRSLQLSLDLEQFTVESLLDSGIIDLLKSANSSNASSELSDLSSKQPPEIDMNLLLQVLEAVLEKEYQYSAVLEFTQACAACIPDIEAMIALLVRRASHIGYLLRDYVPTCQYLEIGLELDSNHISLLSLLAYFYVFEARFDQAIQMARRFYSFCQTPREKLQGNAALLRCLLRAGGNWDEAIECFEQQKVLLRSWLESQPVVSEPDTMLEMTFLTTSFFYFSYLDDQPQQIHQLQNQLARLCQESLEAHLAKDFGSDYRPKLFPPRIAVHQPRPLKIAYVSCFLRRHSIGWLARWLFQHHDRDRFEVHAYLTQHTQAGPFTHKWFVDKAARAACFSGDPLGVAQAVHDNEIDILVDLDSLTVDNSATLLALKPAPVQVTWLGWDAAGIPAVDYFIADPYVLPESAQNYYTEKIWRLPTTYIAVDGFEVGTPTLRRDLLDIPSDAVIYFSSQTGQKRNPENIRWQLRIIREVSNSYFLVKGFGSETSVKKMFEQLAEEEGVAIDRLRFLPPTLDEETHRANLAIADVVLDTFPFNGATTTLETLWMGIPLVTRVGQQFAARNSYTMMRNAGISEGIAWTDEEYIEWGVRLGKDAALRQQISWRLKQSRQTAPLWNAKQFTREMENAYEQMWQNHLS